MTAQAEEPVMFFIFLNFDIYPETQTDKVATQAAGGLSFLATRSLNLFRKRIVRIDVYTSYSWCSV